jgi:type IV pilus assembly protein PilO
MAMPPLDPQQRKNVILGAVLLAIVAYFGYDMLYSPRAAEAVVLREELATVQAANVRARAIAHSSGADAVEERLGVYRRQLELVEGLIPSSEEVPDLLDAIAVEAQRAGVRLTLIQPVAATQEAFYTRRSYDMAVVGRYHEIGEFLTQVASLSRIVTPTTLSLSPLPNPDPEAPMELDARFSIETYVIPSTPIEG